MPPDDDEAIPPALSFHELSHLSKAGLICHTNRFLKLSGKATDHAFFPLRAQIFMQEMTRRSQNRQSWIMIGCTVAILILTVFIAWATFFPPTQHADRETSILTAAVTLGAMMTPPQIATLASALFGLVGTAFLYWGSVSVETGLYNQWAHSAEKTGIETRNRRRMWWQRIGLGLLALSFIAEAVPVFLH